MNFEKIKQIEDQRLRDKESNIAPIEVAEKEELTWEEILQKSRENEQKEKEDIEQTIEKEKNPEEVLNEKRTSYADAYNSIKVTGFKKDEDLQFFEATIEPLRKNIAVGDSERLKLKNDSQEYKEANERRDNFLKELGEKGVKKGSVEAFYNVELAKAEYENSKQELAKKLILESAGKVGKHELFQKFIIDEQELLNKAKVESWPPKDKTVFKKGMEWWMRRNTATRLLISTGLVTGVVATAGGFSAPAIAMFAGYRYIRGAGAVLAGKLAGRGFDWFTSKTDKKTEEISLNSLKTDFDLSKLKSIEKEYRKILEKSAKNERTKLITKAIVMAVAGAGTAVGMGMIEQAYAGGIKVAPEPEPQTPMSETPQAEPEIPETVKAVKGDSIWKISEKYLEEKGDLDGLNPEQKIYAIDALKDKLSEGIENPDALKIGQEIDFGAKFESSDIDKFVEGAKGLSPEQMENISEYQAETPEAETVDSWDKQLLGGAEEKIPEVTEITREIITKKLFEDLSIGSKLYDEFAGVNLKEMVDLKPVDFSVSSGGEFWEDWEFSDENKFFEFQKQIKGVYDKLPLEEKLSANKMSIAGFTKNYFDKLFSK